MKRKGKKSLPVLRSGRSPPGMSFCSFIVLLFMLPEIYLCFFCETKGCRHISPNMDIQSTLHCLFLLLFYWSTVALHCCISFCHTMKWISDMCTVYWEDFPSPVGQVDLCHTKTVDVYPFLSWLVHSSFQVKSASTCNELSPTHWDHNPPSLLKWQVPGPLPGHLKHNLWTWGHGKLFFLKPRVYY